LLFEKILSSTWLFAVPVSFFKSISIPFGGAGPAGTPLERDLQFFSKS
jgi:hypothetical protein